MFSRRFFIACGALASMAFCAPALAKTAIVTAETPACKSWAGWHEWVQTSLTAKGADFSKDCPTSIPKGAKVEFVRDDEEGAVVVRWRGKEWFTHWDRLKE